MKWFRWWHGTTSDPKFGGIAVKTGETLERVLFVWAALEESASDNDNNRGEFTCDPCDIAALLHCPEDSVIAIITAFRLRDMIDGSRFTAWDKRNPARDDAAQRQRTARDKRVTVTPTTGDARKPDTDSDTDSESERTVPSERTRARKAPLPEISELDDELRGIAATEGIDAEREFANCRDWCADNNKPLTKARVRRWFRDDRFRKPGGKHERPEQPGRTGRFAAAASLIVPEGVESVDQNTDGAGPGVSGRAADRRGKPGAAEPVRRIAGSALAGRNPDPNCAGEGAAGVEVLPDRGGDSGGAGTGGRPAGPGRTAEPASHADRGLAPTRAAAAGGTGGDRAGDRAPVARVEPAADALDAFELGHGRSLAGISPGDGGAGQRAGGESPDGLDLPDFLRRNQRRVA